MSNQNRDPSEEQHSHIREKIIKQGPSPLQLAGRFLAILLAAAVTGGVAGAVFAVVRPLAESRLAPSAPEPETLTIPKDQPETQEESTAAAWEPETESSPAESPDQVGHDELESSIRKALEEYTYAFETEDLSAIAAVMNHTLQEADKGIVTVRRVSRKTDWFDQITEIAGESAGAMIARTDQELLVLTSLDSIGEDDKVEVCFAAGTAEAYIKGMDPVNGMAVIAVSTENLPEGEEFPLIPLGNSYTCTQGDPVGAIGAPADAVHSSTTGRISYVARNAPVTDGTARLLYADIKAGTAGGSFLVNLAGEIIGWPAKEMPVTEDGIRVFTAVSDYKTTLEMMSNGREIPYLGLLCREVELELPQEEAIDRGLYIEDVRGQGPAFEAGIKPGDILIEVSGKEIRTLREYQSQLEGRNIGAGITITVLRQAVDSYKRMDFPVTVGSR